MTEEFRKRLVKAGADELARNSCMVDEEAELWVAGLIAGYQLGNPGAFSGMCGLGFDDDGGVRTLVREALELERMVTTR